MADHVPVVWDILQEVLRLQEGHRLETDRALTVVDLGGGTGGLAVRIAGLGHHVTVVDPSPDALASLERRAAEAGASSLVRGVLGDAGTLLEVVEPASVDMVVCHGVLEVVDSPNQALRAAQAALGPDGCLSVLATQRSGEVFAHALAGHFAEARTLLTRPSGDSAPSPRRFTRADLESLVTTAELAITQVRGIRVFADHVSRAMVDADPGLAEDLHALESAVCDHPDFMAVATHLHLLATKP